MPKVIQSVEEKFVDDNGNEISRSTNRVLSWGDEPPYIKLYLQDIMYLSDVPTQYAKVTAALLRRLSYAGEKYGLCVVLVPIIKHEICEELGWKTIAALDNALQKLLAGKILYRVAKGVYRFNPYLFGKGYWKDIEKLRINIDYNDIKGRTFQTNIEYKAGKRYPPGIEYLLGKD